SVATLATHCRIGALASGAPLISHSPGCVCASAEGCAAAISASADATPPPANTRVAMRAICGAFSTASLTAVSDKSAQAISGQLIGLDGEARRAEGAIDPDQAVVADHRLAFLGRETRDDRTHVVRVAAAAAAQRDRVDSAQLVLVMEQAPDELVERKLGVGQLLRLHRSAKDGDVRPIGMIEPRVQPLAPLLALRQVLKQQSPGEPMAAALFRGETHQARDLLGLGEITLRGVAEVLALERHDALVSFVRHRLVEGDREIAVAEQLLKG